MQRLSAWVISLLAVAAFAAAGYVIVQHDPVPHAGQVLALPSTGSGGDPSPSAAGSSSGSPLSGTIAYLGDDWTSGSGASSPAKRFTTLLSKDLGLTERNFGANGTGYAKSTSSAGTYDDRVDAVVAAEPSVVVVSGGRNDITDYVPTLQSDIADLFSTLHAKLPQATIIAIEPFWGDSDKPSDLAPVAAAVRKYAAADGATYLAVPDPVHGHPSWMANASDPNDKGYAAIAAALAAPVRAALTG